MAAHNLNAKTDDEDEEETRRIITAALNIVLDIRLALETKTKVKPPPL